MKTKFKRLLHVHHAGAEALESVILMPLMFMTVILLLYFSFTMMSYIAYNNIANSIAQDLNMRQTGYKMSAGYTIPTLTMNGEQVTPTVTVNPSTSDLLHGTYFAVDKYKDHFIMPYTKVKSIVVNTSKPINQSAGKKLAGTKIEVLINYESFFVAGKNIQNGETPYSIWNNLKIPMTATGYNIIS